MPITFTVKIDGDQSTVLLEGDIGENGDLAFLGTLPPGVAHLDLAAVHRINSAGVRRWIEALATATASAKVVLERCSSAFVRQMGMVHAMTRGCRVGSVMLPYLCTSCEGTLEVPFTLRSAVVDESDLPNISCPSCGGVMDFDDIPSGYFSFLTRDAEALLLNEDND